VVPVTPEQLLATKPKLQQALSGCLESGERIKVLIIGAFDQAVIGTDRRVLVYKAGFMAGASFGRKIASWDYRNVTGIQFDVHMNSAILMVHAAGTEPVKASYWASGKGSAQQSPNAITFASKPADAVAASVAALRNLVAGAQSVHPVAPPEPDAADQIRKLGELRDAGLLTDDEFQAKKAELLKRI
jgi:Short C-terminal domain